MSWQKFDIKNLFRKQKLVFGDRKNERKKILRQKKCDPWNVIGFWEILKILTIFDGYNYIASHFTIHLETICQM